MGPEEVCELRLAGRRDRCLFIASEVPFSPNFGGGGAAVNYEQLSSLLELGVEVHVWHIATSRGREAFDRFNAERPQEWAAVCGRCASVTCTTFPTEVPFFVRLRARIGDWNAGRRIANPWYRTRALSQFRRLVRTIRPSLVWASHFAAAQVATIENLVPVVYSHHDWLFRIKSFSGALSDSARLRGAEEQTALAADAVVTGSITEAEELSSIGCRRVTYIPVAYDGGCSVSEPIVPPVPRLVHLGGMNTTANRLGLQSFMTNVWPSIKPLGLELAVIGDMGAAPVELATALRVATCHGFVADIARALRPYDIFIIPWENNTGQRTKFPLALSHRQAVVSTRAAVACFPEANDGVNCCLVDSLAQMSAAITHLANDGQRRKQIADRGRQTFGESFTRHALLPRYASLLQSLDDLRYC